MNKSELLNFLNEEKTLSGKVGVMFEHYNVDVELGMQTAHTINHALLSVVDVCNLQPLPDNRKGSKK